MTATRLTISALLVLFAGLGLLFNLPAGLHSILAPYHAPIALELLIAVSAAALLPALQKTWFQHLAAALTLFVIAVRLGNLAAKTALDRYFNLYLDLQLGSALIDLAVGTFGTIQGSLVIAGVLALLVMVYLGCVWWFSASTRLLCRHRILALALCLLAGTAYTLQKTLPEVFGPWRLVALKSPDLIALQWRLLHRARGAEQRFQEAVRTDPFAALPTERLLGGLGGADVLLLFIESYGSSALHEAPYAGIVQPVLTQFKQSNDRHQLHAVSGWLESPTVGGQSWLAHGTALSGLWLDSQLLYDLLLQSERRTLVHYFAAAGYRTVAGMPAIIKDWPEAAFFDYHKLYAYPDFDYAGPPYNWVTMPDQYTLAVLQRRERSPNPRPPVFAEVALISSHAPWTPIPEVIEDWSQVGDGAVFARWLDNGDAPAVVWRDSAKIRLQYAKALAYVLRVLASYSRHFAGRDTLLIILGDHQPAPLLTGANAPRTVPIHVISGNPRLLRPFHAWGLTPGMTPGGVSHRMDQLRDLLLGAYSESNHPDTARAP